MLEKTLAAAVCGFAVVALSGCGDEDIFQTKAERAACPVATILAPASSLTAFKEGMGIDPAGELYNVQLVGVTSNCDFDKDEGRTDSHLVLTFRATRPPTGESGQYTVPYFVSQTLDGTTILSKATKAVVFAFPPGAVATTFSAEVPSLVTKFDNGKKPYQYGIVTGIQLTREQMDYNDKMARYAQ